LRECLFDVVRAAKSAGIDKEDRITEIKKNELSKLVLNNLEGKASGPGRANHVEKAYPGAASLPGTKSTEVNSARRRYKLQF